MSGYPHGLGADDTFMEDDTNAIESLARDLSKLKAPENEAKKKLAEDFLRNWINEDVQDQVREAAKEDPEGWHVPYHFAWGMGVRNALRTGGYNEESFGIENLDNIYVELVRGALGIESPGEN